MRHYLPLARASILGLCLTGVTSGQWVQETYPLVAGWNAIWLSHNPSHDPSRAAPAPADVTLDSLLAGTPVEQVWRWNPVASRAQFTQSPVEPEQADTQWMKWDSDSVDPADGADGDSLQIFTGNAAYLVQVSTDFQLTLTGKPLPPIYSWNSAGLNFFGFPMQEPTEVEDVPPLARSFERFFSFSSALSAGPDIFRYEGGLLAENPVRITAPRNKPVARGRAYWIRSSQFTDYYGPLRISVASEGLNFGEIRNAATVRIKNVTSQTVTASLAVAGSAIPPRAPVSAGPVPLLIRGGLDPETARFTYTDLDLDPDRDLAPGEEVEVIIAVDRVTMGGTAGQVFQSILQITDSENISRIDLPVRAVTTSRSGLWVGAAVINTVEQITASNRRKMDLNGDPLYLDEEGEETTEDTGVPAYVTDEEGNGTIDVTNDADADAPSSFPLRLLFHRDDAGNLKLLQQVFLGEGSGGGEVIATAQASLDPGKLATARRLSSASFPFGRTETASGDLGLSGTASFNVVLGHEAKTNPFVHTYHPDHDNKVDGSSPPVPIAAGRESFTITRNITLRWDSDPGPNLGIADLGWGSTVLGGRFEESIDGLRAQTINVRGTFVIYRVSEIPTLTE